MHAGEYKENHFTPVVRAMNLFEHVDLITSNPKKFQQFKEKLMPQQTDGTVTRLITIRQDNLTNRIRQQAYQIYVLAHMANEIELKHDYERFDQKLEMLKDAIYKCEQHLACIQLCRNHFKLTFKKVKYWGELTLKVREALQHQFQKEAIRYQKMLQQHQIQYI